MKDIKILVATHKLYEMPNCDLYIPLHVGGISAKELGYVKDCSGDNISNLNPLFCELTGLYWGWKNINSEYIGLVHYRRYFRGKMLFIVNHRKKHILSPDEINKKLEDCDVILPKKRNYYIETIYSHYKHTMYVEPLDLTGNIIKDKFPEYLPEFEKLKIKKKAHMFNMFIMKKEILDGYCMWLFEILFELQTLVDSNKYDNFHKRFYGRISEMLLDVYINTNNIKYKEIKVENIDGQKKFKKALALLKSKFLNRKYEQSF